NVISDPLKLDVAGGTLTGPLLVASGVNIATLQGGATGEPVVVGAAPTSGDPDVGVVVKTRGTGALMTAVPNSAATGGNARGANAVDWQTSRSAAAQVASGAGATIAGGTLNTASGSGATVIGGSGNVASGQEATAGGAAAQASAMRAFAYGNNALSDGWYSRAWGNFPWARGWYGADVHSAGRFTTAGDAQRSSHVMRGQAVAAAAVRLTANGRGAPAPDTIINLANNTAVSGVVHVTARDQTTANCARWAIPFGMARATGVGSTTLVAGTVDFQNIIGADASKLMMAISADTVNGGINLTFTPPNANTWNVVAAIHLSEVQ
ncbi:MAG: hypothetical protein IT555_10955, partial [Acetobacteraceae bacterium]|nr:hypothetical protein [Acetobacteraceae bacterium]